MNLPTITFILVFTSVAAIYLLWFSSIRPFIKQFTGGKAHGWWWNTAIFQDYFLAKRIIRKEKIKTPSSIRVIEVLLIVNVVFVLASCIEIRIRNHQSIVNTPTGLSAGESTRTHPKR
jgi:hypothetical protein